MWFQLSYLHMFLLQVHEQGRRIAMSTMVAVLRSARWYEGWCSALATQVTGSWKMADHAKVGFWSSSLLPAALVCLKLVAMIG